jgi:hypothetical protein
LGLHFLEEKKKNKQTHQANPTQNNTQILHSFTLYQFKQIKSCFCKNLKEKKKKKSFSFASMALVKDEQKKKKLLTKNRKRRNKLREREGT